MPFTYNSPSISTETWAAAIASSACIGFTSLVPWLFNMTFFETKRQQNDNLPDDGRMKLLLSFAIGAILGDIFFHLIPESYHSHIVELNDTKTSAHQKVGISILAGIFMFIIVEMILEKWSQSIDEKKDHRIHSTECDDRAELVSSGHKEAEIKNQKKTSLTNNVTCNNNNNNNNYISGFMDQISDELLIEKIGSKDTISNKKSCVCFSESKLEDTTENGINEYRDCKVIETAGYLSLIANGFDNFTHGLAIGASFLVGTKVGLLTTFVIFIHEIPHEICDYAILVNSGFSRWDAVKAQSSVSLFGILGTASALYVKSVEALHARTVWILPFSAGGFLYIALVNLLPEVLDCETDQKSSWAQVACFTLGIIFMGLVAII